jgi:hypothetical protein
VQSIKDKLNELTAEQMAEQARIEEWRTAIELLESPDDFNGKLEAIKGQSVAIRQLFKDAAAEKGLVWTKDHYSAPQEQAA